MALFDRVDGDDSGCGPAALGAILGVVVGFVVFNLSLSGGLGVALAYGGAGVGGFATALALFVLGGIVIGAGIGALIGRALAASREPPDSEE